MDDEAYYETVLDQLDEDDLEAVASAAATLHSAAARLEEYEAENGATDVAEQYGDIARRQERIERLAVEKTE
ncbi:hypothetical protein [Halobaculum sp. P14]|uniref:hypothetical protein n=1 Tax=Halobaculum sp. P14 TaxID=3421638 RepID=UPI003EBED269